MNDAMPTLQAAAGESGNNQPMVVYGISSYDSNAMKSDNSHSGVYEADTSRTLDLNGGNPACNQGGMAVVQVETEVNVRKYPVDTKKLADCLRKHRNISIGQIAEKLNKPKTLVEHWFRNDNSFAIPDADIWIQLKDLLNIDTDEFDVSILTYETKPGKYDMANRIHMGEISPTFTASSENTIYCLEGNGQRESHKGDGYKESDTMYTLNTVEQHAVAYRKTSHPQTADQGQGWEETNVNDTLNIFDNSEGRTPTLVIENHPQDSRVKIREDGIFQTLDARMGMGGGNVPMVMENNPIYSIGHDIRSAKFTDDEITDPLTATDYKDPIKISTYQDVTGCLDCGITKGTGNQLANQDMFVANTSVVRRLTPLECERLQGFPDGWTDIGEWVDSKGKKHKDADSPRYKALGNSIALPYWSTLAEKIRPYLGSNPTMASLFDGIGGFPLVFSRVGVTPVWASEIEEFPIAVTKLRFPEKKHHVRRNKNVQM